MSFSSLPDDFGHFAPLGEVDELLGDVEEVRVALLQEQDVGLVLPEEGDAGRVDGAQLLEVELEVVRHQARRVLQGLRDIKKYGWKGGKKSSMTIMKTSFNKLKCS